MPVCVGVGVSTPAQAAQVCEVADGVVVGSALVRRLLQDEGPDGAAAFIGSFRERHRLDLPGRAGAPPARQWHAGPPPSGGRRATRSPAGPARPSSADPVSAAQDISPCRASVSEQALAAKMCSASAASVVSGTGSPENTQGCAVQIPCPSRAPETSTRVTFSTWCARASATAPATALFSAARTIWAAAKVLAALGLRPLHTRLVCRPDAPVPWAICDGSGIGW